MKATKIAVPVAVLMAILLGGGLWFSATPAHVQQTEKSTKFPQWILIIRHAEKTGEKADIHLSKQGQQRAEMLYQLFVASAKRPDAFPSPDFIFAASNEKNSHRPVETIAPLASKRMMTIHQMYTSKLPATLSKKGAKDEKDGTEIKETKEAKKSKKKGMSDLRDELFGDSKYFGKTILVCWRHSTIGELAKTLKARNVPEKWKDKVFDRVWQITYDDAGTATFLDRPQRLLPGDTEK